MIAVLAPVMAYAMAGVVDHADSLYAAWYAKACAVIQQFNGVL